MDKKMVSGVLITLVVAGTAGFFGGMKYQQSKITSSFRTGNFAGTQGRGGMFQQGMQGAAGARAGRQAAGGQFISGQVLSKDDKSITVKVGDTGSKIIFYSGTTSIGKITSGTMDDITVGKQLMVSGTTNSDGSITAQNIQIRPEMPAAPLGK